MPVITISLFPLKQKREERLPFREDLAPFGDRQGRLDPFVRRDGVTFNSSLG